MISKEHILKICKELNLEFVEDNRPGYCHYIYLKHPMLKYDNGDIICEIDNEWQLHLFGKTYYWLLNFPVIFQKTLTVVNIAFQTVKPIWEFSLHSLQKDFCVIIV